MRIGIDLGGTKIEAIALDAAGEAVFGRRVPTPRGDYAATLRAIVGLVADADAALGGPGSVGVGVPGIPSRATGLMKNANSTCLIGRPLVADLEAALRRPVRVENDANCFALSEATDGSAKGAEVVFGVILGTGVGGCVVVRGAVLPGRNGIAGEWGHNPLPWPTDAERPGPRCYCGKHGCIETFLSGPGLASDHAAATGASLAPPELADRAAGGDPGARAALDRHADRLARSLATVINVLDPDAVVLGGGLSRLAHLYEEVPRRWGAYVFSDRVDTRLLPPAHGDASGVRGAAWLWPT